MAIFNRFGIIFLSALPCIVFIYLYTFSECVKRCYSRSRRRSGRCRKMAIVLVHLRRVLLMCCILYLTCDLISELVHSVKLQNTHLNAKKYIHNLQFWTHVYVIYTYILFIVNGYRWDRLNIFEFAFSTSSFPPS